MRIFNYEKKEMIPLTDEVSKSYEKQKVCYICKKEFNTDKNGKNVFKLYHKVRDHCHYTRKFKGAAHSICNLRYKALKEIPIIFHKGSTCDYHFIIKQLVKELMVNLNAQEKIQKNLLLFSIKKELDNLKTITHKLKFIDSFRFMSTLLSSLSDNLLDGLHCNTFIDCKSSLDYIQVF